MNKNLWLFAVSFLISIIGLQAQNNVWSLPPYYYNFGSYTTLPAPGGSSGIFLNYAGGAADYTHAAMQDINGDILFFMVDGVIYDKDGYGMGELDGSHLYALGNFKGITEIIIVPVPENCEQYYIVGVFADNNPLNAGTTFKPFYAILDLSVPNTSSGRLGTLVDHSGSELLTANLYDLTSSISPSWTLTKTKNVTIAASKLRTDNTYFLFATDGANVWRYIISSTGIAFDNYSFSLPLSQPNAIDMRSEMELYEFSNGNYRIAVPYSSGDPSSKVFISDLDNDGDLIPSTDHVLNFPSQISPSTKHAFIKGLEFSPNGRYLYLTHITNSLTFTSFPFKIYDTNTSSYVTPVHSGLINDIPNFQHSTIELASDGKLYFANGSNLATIDNADDPGSGGTLSWNNSQVSLSSYNYNTLGGSYPVSNSMSLYVIPDQIDGMDYTAHFTSTPECCIIYTSFDVEADKNNQEYTGTATWSPGAGNNPFSSVSGTVTVRDKLVIKQGANITINSMTFEFAVGARLIVENGARLTINGTTLTVYSDCGGNALMWQGVEVWGIGTGTFQAAVSGKFIAQNYSVIEHAIEGAVNFNHAANPSYANNGGIIQATTGTKFRNNVKDVVFNAFQSVFNGNPYNDQSYFNDVTFITDASLNDPTYNNSITHATLNEVTGINFTGCDFENTDIAGTTYPYLNRGQGILTYNSKFTVNARCLTLTIPCTSFDESNFTNLTEGIVALNTIRTQVAFVNKSNFNNNFKSIYIFNMEAAKITENDFDIGASVSTNFSYGLYLNNCSGYIVENNNLTTTYGGYVGVYVNNSGTAANEIYRNNFSNLIVGSQAASTNGDNIGNGVGLEFRCNNYESIVDYDILISSGMVADDHGNCLTVTGPSNNEFSYTAQYGDFWAVTSSVGIPTYRYSPNSSNLEPRNGYFNILNTAKQECINLPAFNSSNSCPNRQGGGRTMFMMSTELTTQEAEYDSINNLMSTKDTSLLTTLEEDMAVVKSQMQRTRSYMMQELLLGDENSDGKLEAINFLQQHAAYNTNADEQALAQLYISTNNIGAAQSKIAQLQSKPNNGQFVEFSNIAITLKQHPKQSKALLKDSVLLQQVKDLANHPNENSAVASARSLLESLGLAIYEETIEVVIPTGSKARLANEEETKTTNKNSFVKVFPNPANDNLIISHNLATKEGVISLEIMDVMGRVLINKTINNTNNQIDINQLSSGLYFYNIIQNDKMVQSGKLVVE
jgi:hypothetical protein